MEEHLLGDGWEDAEASSELLDGTTCLEPAMPLFLLGLEEIIAEMFPLLGCKHTQDPKESKRNRLKEAQAGKWSRHRTVMPCEMILCSKWTFHLFNHSNFYSYLRDYRKHEVCRLVTHKKISVRWLMKPRIHLNMFPMENILFWVFICFIVQFITFHLIKCFLLY